MIIQDESRAGAKDRLAAYAVVACLAGGLIVVTQASSRAKAQAAAVIAADQMRQQERLDRSDALVAQYAGENGILKKQRDALSAEVDILRATTPTERIIVQACDVGHETPIFSRDTQFVGGHRR